MKKAKVFSSTRRERPYRGFCSCGWMGFSYTDKQDCQDQCDAHNKDYHK